MVPLPWALRGPGDPGHTEGSTPCLLSISVKGSFGAGTAFYMDPQGNAGRLSSKSTALEAALTLFPSLTSCLNDNPSP